MSESGGVTKEQWGAVAGGGVVAWIGLSLVGIPVLGGVGAVVAIVGAVQYFRTPDASSAGERKDSTSADGSKEGNPW
jgi:hypothetical protein